MIFSVAECWLALVCASAPALKGFIEAYIVPNVSIKSQGLTSKLATINERITPFGSNQVSGFKTSARRDSDVELSLTKADTKDKLDITVYTRFSMTSDAGYDDYNESRMQHPMNRF